MTSIYTCGYCGKEVTRNTYTCPHCGVKLIGVREPKKFLDQGVHWPPLGQILSNIARILLIILGALLNALPFLLILSVFLVFLLMIGLAVLHQYSKEGYYPVVLGYLQMHSPDFWRKFLPQINPGKKWVGLGFVLCWVLGGLAHLTGWLFERLREE